MARDNFTFYLIHSTSLASVRGSVKGTEARSESIRARRKVTECRPLKGPIFVGKGAFSHIFLRQKGPDLGPLFYSPALHG
jgi:hypothetical protein